MKQFIQAFEAADIQTTSPKALSFCLFNSPAYRSTKHWENFLTWLSRRDCPFDVVIASTHHFIPDLPKRHFIKVVEVPQLEGYLNHLSRYASVALPYSELHFRGTDIHPGHPLTGQMEHVASYCKMHYCYSLMEKYEIPQNSGRCSVLGRGTAALYKALNDPNLSPDPLDWNLDQKFLHKWWMNDPSLRTVINSPLHLSNDELTTLVNLRCKKGGTILMSL